MPAKNSRRRTGTQKEPVQKLAGPEQAVPDYQAEETVSTPELLRQVRYDQHQPKPQAILQLQGAIGNQAVQRLLQRQPALSRPVPHPAQVGVIQRFHIRYSGAISDHRTHMTTLETYVQHGEAGNDTLTKNSMKWFRDGKAKLFAVTTTAQPDSRATALGKAGQRAVFGYDKGGQVLPNKDNLADDKFYNKDDKTDDTNVQCIGQNTMGQNFTGADGKKVITVVEPGDQSEAAVLSTLRHEVQHSADRHTQLINSKGYAGASKEESLERYKSEVRAYVTQGGGGDTNYATLSTVNNVPNGELAAIPHASGNVWKRRKWEIFKHLYNGYDYVKTTWNSVQDGAWYRQQVLAYEFETLNPNNSVLVDTIYDDLEALGAAAKTPEALETDPEVGAFVLKYKDKLTAPECQAILTSAAFAHLAVKNKYLAREVSVKLLNVQPAQALAADESLNVRTFNRKVGLLKLGTDNLNELKALADTVNEAQARHLIATVDWAGLKQLADYKADLITKKQTLQQKEALLAGLKQRLEGDDQILDAAFQPVGAKILASAREQAAAIAAIKAKLLEMAAEPGDDLKTHRHAAVVTQALTAAYDAANGTYAFAVRTLTDDLKRWIEVNAPANITKNLNTLDGELHPDAFSKAEKVEKALKASNEGKAVSQANSDVRASDRNLNFKAVDYYKFDRAGIEALEAKVQLHIPIPIQAL